MELTTSKKRVLVSFIIALILIITGLFFYFLVKPPATCTDGIKNQSEKEVDCGGTCTPCNQIFKTKDLTIKESAVVFGGNKTYDVVAKISNPNDAVGASSFKYSFKLKDASGNVVATKDGSNFILPADTKYVTELGIQTENDIAPTAVELVISDPKWEKLSKIGKPQIGVYSKNFGKNSSGIGSVVDGIIRNESGYDLTSISITVILRSEDGKIVAANKTEKNAVRIKEERDFRLNWPYDLPAPVQNVEVDTQVNVFDSQNFSFSL